MFRLSSRTTRLVASVGIAASALALVGVSPAEGATPNRFARVAADGSLLQGAGVSGVSKTGTGVYEVTFTSNVSACAFVATTVQAYSQATQAYTAGGHASANGVYVETKNQGGGLTDAPFNLAVDCGTPGTKYAVVNTTGGLARATPGATIGSPGTGRYNVNFGSSLNGCAYLASVGDPANGLVFNPANVSTGLGPNAQTVYVETKNPGGGLSSGIPFHLAVICPSAPNTKGLVAASTGFVARASNATSAFLSSTGNYVAVTNRSLASCAAIATRGSSTAAVPYNPGTMEITTGPAVNTFGVQARTLLGAGGDLTDLAFHAVAFC